jgi:hypothetical protein
VAERWGPGWQAVAFRLGLWPRCSTADNPTNSRPTNPPAYGFAYLAATAPSPPQAPAPPPAVRASLRSFGSISAGSGPGRLFFLRPHDPRPQIAKPDISTWPESGHLYLEPISLGRPGHQA